jgi:hypothetical protein
LVLSAIHYAIFLALYESVSLACDGDYVVPPLFFNLEIRVVVFRQSLLIEGKSGGDVSFALSRAEPTALIFRPAAGGRSAGDIAA